MKLLSCYIENFGKISQTEYKFSPYLTEFCEENGFGKTTLAAFIKAMFYGLPSYKTTTKDFPERLRYFPFNGGSFGGNLRFEMGGREYKIERFFDKKSDVKDELRVYLNGAETNELGEEIGKAVFGLDEASFTRTVFVTANDEEICSTGGINARLNHYVENTDGEGDFESAIDALDGKIKQLKAGRGNNDLITKQKDLVFELRSEIGNLEQIKRGLDEKYAERERLAAELRELKSLQKSVGELQLVKQKWQTYDGLCLEAKNEQAAFDRLSALYANGFPTAEELDGLDVFARKEIAIKTREQDHGMGKRSKFDRVERLPTDGELERARQKTEEYKRAETALKIAMTNPVAQTPTSTPKKDNRKLFALLFVVLTVVMCGCGVGLLAIGETLTAVGLFGAGALFAVVGGVMLVSGGKKAPQTAIEVDFTPLKTELELAEKSLRAFLTPYGFYSENGVLYDFSEFERELSAYRETLARKESLEKEKASLEAQINAVRRKYAFLDGLSLSAFAQRLKFDCAEGARLERSAKAALEKALEYKRLNGLENRDYEGSERAVELETEVSEKTRALALVDDGINADETLVERLADKYNSLELETEKLEYYKTRLDLLQKTKAALTAAEQRLKDKYVQPIKDGFCGYAEAIERALGEKVSMDENFRITFERNGVSRHDRHLSAGQRAVADFCFRLALVDNMYETELPFIVLDDPFVKLDEEHFRSVAKVLRSISEDKQLVYFTCHESRRIEK